MPYDPNLFDGLSLFTEVVDTGSFTRTADNTGHSTSHISKEISKLEARLGIRLLHRTTRSLNLTPEGEMFYQQCRQLVSDAQQTKNLMLGQQAEPSGLLRISCPASFGMSSLQSVFSEFIETYPEVNLELDLSNRKVDMIADGYDLLIRASHQMPDSSLISKRIYRSYAVTLASPDYLRRFGTPETPGDLTAHQCGTYSYLKTPERWQYGDHDGNTIEVEVRSRVQTNNPELELSLALAGKVIVRLPRFLLSDELETGRLVELFADYPRQFIDVYVMYPSRRHLSPKTRAFIDHVTNAFSCR